tara:strand:- start:2339 stop:2851 length:513 start_codon:yes stop_codon:yes gene_type:complete
MVQQIENQNFLSPIGFQFSINRLPNVQYFVQTTNIPGVTATSVPVQNPFSVQHFHGDHLEYNELNVSFRVDENLNNYSEILSWMLGIDFPDNFDQHADIIAAQKSIGEGIFSDATLIILNSTKNPNISVKFEDMFPVSLTDIPLSVTEGDIVYPEATASFRFKRFVISTL